MKKISLIALVMVVAVLPGCQSRRNNEVVKVTFLHKYGVPVEEADWHREGKNGQLVELTNDGITATKSYREGILHGESTYTFPHSSTIQYKENYQEGLLVAKSENYPSGVPHIEKLFEGTHRVKVTSWYEQGTPCTIENYVDGYLVYGEYRNPYNEIVSRVTEGQGIRLQHSQDGEVEARESISNGSVIERVIFYANGEPKSITPFQNGVIHGTCLTFLSGGLPHTVENWVNGYQEGITTVYQNGEKVASIPYIHGKRHGVASIYRDGTILSEEVTWKNDKIHGMRTLHLGEGQKKIEWYIDNELVNKPTFDRLDPIR